MSELDDLVRVCSLAEIPEGEGLRVEVAGLPPLAVWLAGGTAYVTDDTCTHGQASLSEGGDIDGFIIECGLHFGAFDIRDGSVASAPCNIPLKVYKTQVVADYVFIHPTPFGKNEQ